MEIRYGENSFIIDCGILFPYEDTFDIRYLIPNFSKIQKPSRVYITHGHEDHIGALPHLIEMFPGLEIIAPPFAGELIKRKFEYYPRPLNFKLTVSTESSDFFGLEVHYIRVNHSIPDTYGILLIDKKNDTSVFYISDFKVDPKAKLEPVFDFKKLVNLTKGIKTKFLLADITNITSSNKKTPSEEDLKPALDQILGRSNGRIFVTTFSSNIHRLKNLVELSKDNGREVIFYGRSMQNYWEVAHSLGIVDELEAYSDVEAYRANPDKKYTIIVSGCQGDFRSTFRRVAFGHDSYFKIKEDDIFVLSSKSIPGNEKKITLCLNEISKLGGEVITASDAHIHASGHPGTDDLQMVFDQYQPSHYIPIHGETFFLTRHQKWIQDNFTGTKAFKLLNHETFDFISHKTLASTISEEDTQPLIIHGNSFEITRDQIKERRKIAEAGSITIAFNYTQSKLGDIKTIFHGIPFNDELNEDFFNNHIERVVKKNFKGKKTSLEQIRIQSRKVFKDLFGIKPVVSVIDLES